LWWWAVSVFAIHGAVVLTLIKVRGWSQFGGAVWHFVRVSLELGDFWVYRWINPLFNTPAFGTPMFRISEFFGLASLDSVTQFFEFWIDAVFGGLVYALVVVALISLKRSRKRRHELRSAVA
jgi:hypothetical protein